MLEFDELNTLKAELKGGEIRKDLEDSVLDILIMEYVYGMEEMNQYLETEISPSYEEMKDAIYKRFDGENFADRLNKYQCEGKAVDIIKVIDTDSNRVYEQAKYDIAKASGVKLTKTWHTMEDSKVRDTHSYLEGITVDIDKDFYTYDGDHAPFPNAFQAPQNNCNCRCFIEYNK